jgi:hypothetical protein
MSSLRDILSASYQPNRDAEQTLAKDGYKLVGLKETSTLNILVKK